MVVENQPKLPAKAPWRELILFFRCERFHIGVPAIRFAQGDGLLVILYGLNQNELIVATI